MLHLLDSYLAGWKRIAYYPLGMKHGQEWPLGKATRIKEAFESVLRAVERANQDS